MAHAKLPEQSAHGEVADDDAFFDALEDAGPPYPARLTGRALSHELFGTATGEQPAFAMSDTEDDSDAAELAIGGVGELSPFTNKLVPDRDLLRRKISAKEAPPALEDEEDQERPLTSGMSEIFDSEMGESSIASEDFTQSMAQVPIHVVAPAPSSPVALLPMEPPTAASWPPATAATPPRRSRLASAPDAKAAGAPDDDKETAAVAPPMPASPRMPNMSAISSAIRKQSQMIASLGSSLPEDWAASENLRNFTMLFKRSGAADEDEKTSDGNEEAAGDVEVKSRHNRLLTQTLSPLWRVKSLRAHEAGSAVWCLKWSKDGTYLASAGQDGRVVLWQLAAASGPDDAQRGRNISCVSVPEGAGVVQDGPVAELFPVVRDSPIRVYREHQGDVVDLSWSESGFLLSGSIDETVRLWHPTQPRSLGVFPHPDMVTSIDWHPTTDLTFLSACFDQKLRVWELKKTNRSPHHGRRTAKGASEGASKRRPPRFVEGRVVHYAQTAAVPTACVFTPDGEMAVCGTYDGLVYFYRSESMRYFTQIVCRNRRGPYRDGRKVTGLHFRPSANCEGAARGRQSGPRRGMFSAVRSSRRYHLLVCTNDNRIRLFDTGSFAQLCKYKGARSEDLQIRASFSSDGGRIVCASEDGRVYIWDTIEKAHRADNSSFDGAPVSLNPKRDARRSIFGSKKSTNDSWESFAIATEAEEAAAAASAAEAQAPSICTSATFAPLQAVLRLEEAARQRFFDPSAMPPVPVNGGDQSIDLEEWSPNTARCGRVVVTADFEGVVHVFARGAIMEGRGAVLA